jgi:hypothetical protein
MRNFEKIIARLCSSRKNTQNRPGIHLIWWSFEQVAKLAFNGVHERFGEEDGGERWKSGFDPEN